MSLTVALSFLPMVVRGPSKFSAVMPDVTEGLPAEVGGAAVEGTLDKGEAVRPPKPGATAPALVAPALNIKCRFPDARSCNI
jgi:hypothetical protein